MNFVHWPRIRCVVWYSTTTGSDIIFPPRLLLLLLLLLLFYYPVGAGGQTTFLLIHLKIGLFFVFLFLLLPAPSFFKGAHFVNPLDRKFCSPPHPFFFFFRTLCIAVMSLDSGCLSSLMELTVSHGSGVDGIIIPGLRVRMMMMMMSFFAWTRPGGGVLQKPSGL